jgi:hypothetical protein
MMSEHLLQRVDDPPIRTMVEVRKRQHPVRKIRPRRTSDDSIVAIAALCALHRKRVLSSQEPLRSCHKWPESGFAPKASQPEIRCKQDRRTRDRRSVKLVLYQYITRTNATVSDAAPASQSDRDEQRHVTACGILRLSTLVFPPNDERG